MKYYLVCITFLLSYSQLVFAEARINEMCKPLSKQMRWHKGDTVYWENNVILDYEQVVADSREHATENITFKSTLYGYGYSIDKINEHNSRRLQQECDLTQLETSNACHHFKAYCLNDITSVTMYESLNRFSKCALNPKPWCGKSFSTPEGIRNNINSLNAYYERIAKTKKTIMEDDVLKGYFGDIRQSFEDLQAKMEEAKKQGEQAIAKLDKEIKEKHEKLKSEDERFNNACAILDQCDDYIKEQGYEDDYQLLNQTAFCRLQPQENSDSIEPLASLLKGLNGFNEKKQLKTLAINSLNNSTAQTVKEYASIFKGLYGKKPTKENLCKDLPRFCNNQLAKDTLARLDLTEVKKMKVREEIQLFNQEAQKLNALCIEAQTIGVDEELGLELQTQINNTMIKTRMGQLMAVPNFRDKIEPFNQEKCLEDGEGLTLISEDASGDMLVRDAVKDIIELQKDKSDQITDHKNQVQYAGKWTSANDSDYFDILKDIIHNDPFMVREAIKESGDPDQALWICKATHDVYRSRRVNNWISGIGSGLAIVGALAATVFTFGAATPLLVGSIALATGVGVYNLDKAMTARHNAEKSIAIKSADIEKMIQDLPNLDTQVKMAVVEISMSILPGVMKGASVAARVAGSTIGKTLQGSKLIALVPQTSKLTGPSKVLFETIKSGGKITHNMVQKAMMSRLGQANPKAMAGFIQLIKDAAPDVALEITAMAAVFPDPPGPFSEEGMKQLTFAVTTSIGMSKLGMSGRQYMLNRQAKKNIALVNNNPTIQNSELSVFNDIGTRTDVDINTQKASLGQFTRDVELTPTIVKLMDDAHTSSGFTKERNITLLVKEVEAQGYTNTQAKDLVLGKKDLTGTRKGGLASEDVMLLGKQQRGTASNKNKNIDDNNIQSPHRGKPSNLDIETYQALQLLEPRIDKTKANNFVNKLTDPKQHDDSNFTYVVHTFNLKTLKDPTSMQFERFSNPDKLSDILLSTSVINQDYRKTWGTVGYILDVPPNNLLYTTPTNSWVNNSAFNGGNQTYDFVNQTFNYYKRYGIMEPNEVIKRSTQSDMNEVVITGTSSTNTKVKPKGIVIKGDVPQDIMGKVKEISRQRNIPIIYLDN